MSYSTQQKGLNRTNWNNKNEYQKRQALKKHYSNQGKDLPKYLQKGHITDKKLNQALNSLNHLH